MKLSELVEKEGLSTVSDKTTISIEILQDLVDNNFENLSRVKSLGFLSILRREYGIKLDDMESALKEYFEENSNEDNEPILISVDKTSRGSGSFKWIIILALLGGLWYLYNSDKLGGNLSKTENQENTLNDSEILHSSVSRSDAQDNVVVTKDENRTEVEIQTIKTSIRTEDTILKESEVTTSVEIKSNQTIENNSNKIKNIVDNNLKSLEDNIEKDIKEKESADIENSLDENIEETTNETINADKESIESSTNTIVNEEDIAKIIYHVTVNPKVNLWFGFINIDTKERKEFMTIKSTAIDVGEQRWLLMTGHGRVTVASSSETLEIHDRVKHYFYIDSSEIREIDRSEFKSLNGGRGW